jgi:hypothetical protein
MKQKIKRVDRSPMNERIWIIELMCGHEIYKTQRSKPRIFSVFRDKLTRELMTGYRSMDCKDCDATESPSLEPPQ